MPPKNAIAAGIRLGRIAVSCSIAIANFAMLHVLDFLQGRAWSSRRNLGITLAGLFESLGGPYLKLGQLLASRPDVLNDEVRVGLARLHRNVKPLSKHQVDRIFIDRHLDHVFRVFNTIPIASGSIAQVHIAQLHDGTKVAVKLRRPGVNRSFEIDIMMARSLLALMSRLRVLEDVPILESFDVVAQTLLAQLNLLREAELIRAVKNYFLQSPMIVIPDVFFEHCSEDMLVMEFCDNLLTLDRNHLPCELWEEVAARCLSALYQMIFVDGLVHGDLHPGNVFCRQDGKIVLLDFGICGQMDRSEHKAFVDFFLAFIRGKGKECAEVTLRIAKHFPCGMNRASFANDMETLIARHTGKTVENFQVGRFALEMFEIQRKYGIRSSTGFILPISSLIMLEGTLKELHPKLDFQVQSLRFLFAALSQNIQCHAS